jgi:hypothetical protein
LLLIPQPALSQTLVSRDDGLMMARFRLILVTVPAIVVAILFETFLGHRHDYTGHYLAGYGGTLMAMMVWMRILSPSDFARWSALGNLPLCLGCILIGVFTEATAFRLAKFDEIDFCNQSLGAVLASLAALAYAANIKPAVREFDLGLIAGIAFLGAGGVFAVA